MADNQEGNLDLFKKLVSGKKVDSEFVDSKKKKRIRKHTEVVEVKEDPNWLSVNNDFLFRQI